jgi:hypothetical protein
MRELDTRKRLKNKLALVGFASTTRLQAPFDDPDYEIWTVNEAGNIAIDAFKWVKRFDRLFQIHPRWDFSRKNNGNDPNHFAWLRNVEDVCGMCSGTGKLVDKDCPACDNGTYFPLESRKFPKVIYMQEEYADIPNSVKYPLEEMVSLNPSGKYFDSSLAYMVMLASTMGYQEIFIVGFEMAAQSEYFYQRANFEYLIGLLSARGQVFRFPKETSLLKGPLYGYENMKTGYRQQLDMRIAILNNELSTHNMELAKVEGELRVWKKFEETSPRTPIGEEQFQEVQKRYGKLLGLVNIVKGATYETENLRKLYDTYFVADALDGRTTVREDTDKYVKTTYGAK